MGDSLKPPQMYSYCNLRFYPHPHQQILHHLYSITYNPSKHSWKCCNAILYVFDNLTGMWSDKVDVHNRIISGLSSYLNIIRNTKEGLEYTGKNYANCNHKRKEIFPYTRQNCVDDDWTIRTQLSSLGKVLFKNGYYDFLRSLFVQGHKLGTALETENGFYSKYCIYVQDGS